MATALATSTPNPTRWFQARRKDEDENELIENLQRRADKLSNTYDGLVRQVVKIERRFERYTMAVRHRNDVIDALTSLKNHPNGPGCVNTLLRAMQKLSATVHEFVSLLDLNSDPSDSRSIDTENRDQDAEGPPPTPSRSFSSGGGFSLRKLLSHAQASIVGIIKDNDVQVIIEALMERFDFSPTGLSYLKELLDFCGRATPKSVDDVWRPLACDIRDCLDYVMEDSSSAPDLSKVLTTALRLSMDTSYINTEKRDPKGKEEYNENETSCVKQEQHLTQEPELQAEEKQVLMADFEVASPKNVREFGREKSPGNPFPNAKYEAEKVNNSARPRKQPQDQEKNLSRELGTATAENDEDLTFVQQQPQIQKEQDLNDPITGENDKELTFVQQQPQIQKEQDLNDPITAENDKDLKFVQQPQNEQILNDTVTAENDKKLTLVPQQTEKDQILNDTVAIESDKDLTFMQQPPQKEPTLNNDQAETPNGTGFTQQQVKYERFLNAEFRARRYTKFVKRQTKEKSSAVAAENEHHLVKQQPKMEPISNAEAFVENDSERVKQQLQEEPTLDDGLKANLERDLDLINSGMASLKI